MSVSEPVLNLDHVTVTFGGLVAVDTVSFQVAPGEIVGLIGPPDTGHGTGDPAGGEWDRDHRGIPQARGRRGAMTKTEWRNPNQ